VAATGGHVRFPGGDEFSLVQSPPALRTGDKPDHPAASHSHTKYVDRPKKAWAGVGGSLPQPRLLARKALASGFYRSSRELA
jgi:phytoene dehydrogenase-like protein